MSQSGEGELKLAVAVGRKVTLLRWKHPVVWGTWSVGSSKDVADGFETIKVNVTPICVERLDGLTEINWSKF